MLDLNALDVDEIATALSHQTDYDHRWLIDPQTFDITFWTSETGIDGEKPIDLDDLDLLPIDPIQSRVWYTDMADLAQQVSDPAARQRLARALSGRGAFRRFKNELYEEYPDLVSVWQRFRDARAQRLAVGWQRRGRRGAQLRFRPLGECSWPPIAVWWDGFHDRRWRVRRRP